MLIFQQRFFSSFFCDMLNLIDLISSSFFSFSHFSVFLNQKYGSTPLWIAALVGNEQIVEILLEKGNPNVILQWRFFSSHFFSLIMILISNLID